MKALAACLALAAAAAVGAAAAQPAPIDARWRESFEAFAAADRSRAPAPGGILFVGSSSIRLWNGLETAFGPDARVLQRGFGGSQLSDCVRYLEHLVLPYRPRQVVVYAGDNDLAGGSTPQQVLASFQAFAEGVHRVLPETRVAFISIKPSPLRAALLPQVREANALIAAHSRGSPRLDYIDVYTPMVDAAGQPRGELFLPDRLHLNAEGYALWKAVIAEHLR